ncbi:MAG TPA: hypothetical protein VIR79_00440 [Nitrospira sp.]
MPRPSRSFDALLYGLCLSLVSFAFHFIWELFQCPIFYVHGTFDATMWGMTMAGLGDVCLTWIVYGGVATASRNLSWVESSWSGLQWTAMTLIAIAVAIFVEKRALAQGAWSYTDLAPILPVAEVSAVPILQLTLLTPASFAVAWAIARRPVPLR